MELTDSKTNHSVAPRWGGDTASRHRLGLLRVPTRSVQLINPHQQGNIKRETYLLALIAAQGTLNLVNVGEERAWITTLVEIFGFSRLAHLYSCVRWPNFESLVPEDTRVC